MTHERVETRMLPPSIVFRSVDEPRPGPKLRALYARRAEGYLAWYLREGDAARPSLDEGLAALRTHMPELVPIHDELTRVVADGDPLAARMLTFLRPPGSAIACSQGVAYDAHGRPLLVRNYDYPPDLMDGVILRSRFLDRQVVGTTDLVWGLNDGMNDRGLVVSLTFGGRVVGGDGFGMPLAIRYLLETCDTVAQAREVILRLPFAQAHNLTLADATGDATTVYLSPDLPPSFRRVPIAANHQWTADAWDPVHTQDTFLREWWLMRLFDDPDVSQQAFSDAFLAPPIYSFEHLAGAGTVYTAAYDPVGRTITYRWPGHDWPISLDGFAEQEYPVIIAPLTVDPASGSVVVPPQPLPPAGTS